MMPLVEQEQLTLFGETSRLHNFKMTDTVDMKSQNSDDSDYDESDNMDEDDEDDYCGYYDNDTDDLDIDKPKKSDDPEYFEFDLLHLEDAERLLNEEVEALCSKLKIDPSLAKMLLQVHGWNKESIIERHIIDHGKLLVDSKIKPAVKYKDTCFSNYRTCPVCYLTVQKDQMFSVSCGHQFCKECWDSFFQIQIQQGITTGIECMEKDCNILVPEDFICSALSKPDFRDRYSTRSFTDHIEGHPQLRFCPGPNCSVIVRAKENKAKKVECGQCKTIFCFKCGIDYHAPTDCGTIKKWLTKCADDSETANYISANTKDCPKCHVCIEKTEQCTKCKHDFCWMCLGDWKAHGSEYYECSRYKENPNIANESAHAQAREALKKYLFYFERWENHSKSLELEEQTLLKITSRIQEKVMNNAGTWIDWQYLLDAAALLRKCRYTLQYTYPYAYFMEKGARKQLFEYQQAQLEAEVENLSWKVERAEITDRGDLENQMDVAEKRRQTLLKDFLEI
ncbi:ARIH2 [Mytilus coruscus]|uniref:RBR-type E3 ubiquitin transferase n=1 Tax=Mytilus coruscus TaxID=42192 RepID=A0A6J8CL66_MYTCO|nr:ARIH2 [Mytilus coruscus]